MGLELRPAQESIAARDRKLRVSKPPSVLLVPGDAQNRLGFLSQMLAIALRGPALIHQSYSCSRRPLTGRKSDDRDYGRWDSTFPRTGCSLPRRGG